jgi:adenine-specific DNA methylase
MERKATNVFGNLAKQFDSFTKQFEYKVDLDGKQIFPNDMIKQEIVTNYKSSNYRTHLESNLIYYSRFSHSLTYSLDCLNHASEIRRANG